MTCILKLYIILCQGIPIINVDLDETLVQKFHPFFTFPLNGLIISEQSSMLATSAGDESLTPTASPRLNVTSSTHSKPNSNNSIFNASFRRNDCERPNSGSSNGGKEHKQRKNARMFPLTITVTNNTNSTNEGVCGYQETSMRTTGDNPPISPAPLGVAQKCPQMNNHLHRQGSAYGHTSSAAVHSSNPAGILRRCNQEKSLKRKKRVIQMLMLIIAEFFFCWTPLYVMVRDAINLWIFYYLCQTVKNRVLSLLIRCHYEILLYISI